ncbi:hypothetical protein D917_01739 [Trichinella nativa]|uniref:Uncharacterized protein n=1 Tax=Trichinella nativa TaxID=6335 RepID=A0A1Y3EQ67_9BILA|nr:hypothetical protein D917_01739 [Trichinella nativa]
MVPDLIKFNKYVHHFMAAKYSNRIQEKLNCQQQQTAFFMSE